MGDFGAGAGNDVWSFKPSRHEDHCIAAFEVEIAARDEKGGEIRWEEWVFLRGLRRSD